MRHLILLLMAAVVWLAMSSPTLGQVVGQRLRVETSDGSKVTGTVFTRNTDNFVLYVEGGQKTISFAEVRKMEKYMGEGTNKRKGFIIGTAVGSVSMALAMWTVFAGTCETLEADACGSTGAEGAVAGAIVGAIVPGMFPLGLIGSAIGAGGKTAKWETIANPKAGGREKSRIEISPMLQVASKGDRRAVVGARLHF